MLTLPSYIVERILLHAALSHPIECCGIVAGVPGADMPLRLIPMYNAALSERFFQFDAAQQLRVWREMDAQDEVPLVLYHSHTDSAPYPSRSDIEYAAAYPDTHHLIVTTDPRFHPPMRSFRIRGGQVEEERVVVSSAETAEAGMQ